MQAWSEGSLASRGKVGWKTWDTRAQPHVLVEWKGPAVQYEQIVYVASFIRHLWLKPLNVCLSCGRAFENELEGDRYFNLQRTLKCLKCCFRYNRSQTRAVVTWTSVAADKLTKTEINIAGLHKTILVGNDLGTGKKMMVGGKLQWVAQSRSRTPHQI